MPQSQLSYISCLSILGLFTMVFTQWNRFSTPEYRVVRACLFIALAMSSMIPIFHACARLARIHFSNTKGHFRVGVVNAWEECQLKWIVIMAVSYLFGTYLYATQLPEIKLPGKFDLIGNKTKWFINDYFQDALTIFSMSSLLEGWCRILLVSRIWEIWDRRLDLTVLLQMTCKDKIQTIIYHVFITVSKSAIWELNNHVFQIMWPKIARF